MPRLHPFDGVAVFVHVVHAMFDGQAIERIRADLPGGVEDRCIGRVADGAKPFFAAKIMHAIHFETLANVKPSRPRSSLLWSPAP